MLGGYPFLRCLSAARDPSDVLAGPLGYDAEALAAVRDAVWMTHTGRANVAEAGAKGRQDGGNVGQVGGNAASGRATAPPRRAKPASTGAKAAGGRGNA